MNKILKMLRVDGTASLSGEKEMPGLILDAVGQVKKQTNQSWVYFHKRDGYTIFLIDPFVCLGSRAGCVSVVHCAGPEHFSHALG